MRRLWEPGITKFLRVSWHAHVRAMRLDAPRPEGATLPSQDGEAVEQRDVDERALFVVSHSTCT